MSRDAAQIVLAANAAGRERAGGHLWALAQWALGLRAAGARVSVAPETTAAALAPIEAFASRSGTDASDAAVLNVMGFGSRAELAAAGPWTFLDIDPGYPQMWR